MTNPNPNNSNFVNQSITLNESVYNFKYIVFAIKQEGTNGDEGLMYYKIQPPKTGNHTLLRASYVWSNGTKASTRYFDLIDATRINVAKGYAYGVEDNTQCIPIAVYGTNVL